MRYLLPVAATLILFAFLAIGLRLDPSTVPSPLIGKPVPAFSLPALDGGETISESTLNGRPLLVNYFASWCTPCLQEHPLLMRLAQRGDVELLGINYKDAEPDARAWLARHGNPYSRIARDDRGVAGLDWGVYGVPETFVIAADGTISYKQVGPLNEQVWAREIAPRLGVAP